MSVLLLAALDFGGNSEDSARDDDGELWGDVVAGMLLPPPWAHIGLEPSELTRADILHAVAELRGVGVEGLLTVPLNVAVRVGVYDARVRVAAKRLARLLHVPWRMMAQKESALFGMSASEEELQVQERRQVVVRQAQRTEVIKRAVIASVVTLVGGVLIAVVGTFLLPLAIPTIAGVLGAVESVVAADAALSAIFLALTEATHGAALGAAISPLVISAGALMGGGGSALLGYKMDRRLSVVGEFRFRRPSDAVPVVVEQGGGRSSVVASSLQSVALTNIRRLARYAQRSRLCVVGIANNLEGVTLSLEHEWLLEGCWGQTSPQTIETGGCGIIVAHNVPLRPTGAGVVMCFKIEVRDTVVHQPLAGCRLWVRAVVEFWGLLRCNAAVVEADDASTPETVLRVLADSPMWKEDIFQELPTALLRGGQICDSVWISLTSLLERASTTFSCTDLEIHIARIRGQDWRFRRVVHAVVRNDSRTTLHLPLLRVRAGQPMAECVAHAIPPAHAATMSIASEKMSLDGAEGSWVVAIGEVGFVLGCKVSALDALAAGVEWFRGTHWSTLPHPRLSKEGETFECDDVPIVVRLEMRAEDNVVIAHVEDASPSHRYVDGKMSIVIGVCGFSAMLDATYIEQDQQVAIWKEAFAQERFQDAECLVLQWESDALAKFGRTIRVDEDENAHAVDAATTALGLVRGHVSSIAIEMTSFAALRSFNALLGVANLPTYAIWVADLIDNSYGVLKSRATLAGQELAKALLSPQRGMRPVTLMGFGFGAALILECLLALKEAGARGVVEDVVLMGATIPSDVGLWKSMRSIVAGRLVNVFSRRDWLLWAMYKLNHLTTDPMSGLSAIDWDGVENVDASSLVSSHGSYGTSLHEIIKLIPTEPNPGTLRRDDPFAVGACVPTSQRAATVDRIRSVMPTSEHARVMTLTNDVQPSVVTFLVESVAHHGGRFDLAPPPATTGGHVGVWGVVGPCVGAVGYAIALHPSTAVLIVVYFETSPTRGSVRACVVTKDAFSSMEEGLRETFHRVTHSEEEVRRGLTLPAEVEVTVAVDPDATLRVGVAVNPADVAVVVGGDVSALAPPPTESASVEDVEIDMEWEIPMRTGRTVDVGDLFDYLERLPKGLQGDGVDVNGDAHRVVSVVVINATPSPLSYAERHYSLLRDADAAVRWRVVPPPVVPPGGAGTAVLTWRGGLPRRPTVWTAWEYQTKGTTYAIVVTATTDGIVVSCLAPPSEENTQDPLVDVKDVGGVRSHVVVVAKTPKSFEV